ncbi:hypothetical protein BLNAU_2959 [Blattamonas nauphoetae]|uniref:Uncharacterized protein n=1 Tax=Blattamonas nauphoetae TaxID=2049346 RepID=A0ABQ9YDS0_9EUKA|nr:hypothetical protein BLNAU_2959 [Blattamonas nauphoetae]
MILLVLTTFIYSAVNDTIFLEFGGMSKTCLTADTACHSLDQAVKHAQWGNVSKIVIQGHAELIGEVIFDSNADTFKKTPAGNIKFEMTLSDHVLSSNVDFNGLTGLGTIVTKGTSSAEMHLELKSDIHVFSISTSRTTGGTKKNYVFRVEQYGILEVSAVLIIYPLQLPSTTTFTKLTSNFKTEPWDQKSAAVIVNKGALIMPAQIIVYDPGLGVLILNDIDTVKSQVSLSQQFATSQTSLVPKGIVCSITNSTNTFNITIYGSGNQIWDSPTDLVKIDQYPLDIHFEGKCAAFDELDFDKKFPLNKTDMSNITKSGFIFPEVYLTRSNLKVATQTGATSNDLGNYLVAEFTSGTNSLNVEALRHLKVSIAPRYHTQDTDDAIIRWDEMTWYVGLYETTKEFGGTFIRQSGESGFAVAAVPRGNVGISGEYTVKMEFGDEVRYVGCLYSGARSTVAFATLALLLAVLLGF